MQKFSWFFQVFPEFSKKTQFSRFSRCATNPVQEKGIATVQSSGDADVLIVKEAVDYARENKVVVFADDTDILILLMHHWNPYMRDIYFSTEKLEGSRRVQRQWNIRSVVECQSGEDVTQHLQLIVGVSVIFIMNFVAMIWLVSSIFLIHSATMSSHCIAGQNNSEQLDKKL